MHATVITLALAGFAAAGLVPRHDDDSSSVDTYPLLSSPASTVVVSSTVPVQPVPETPIPIPELGSPSATLTIASPSAPEELGPTAAPTGSKGPEEWPVPYGFPSSLTRSATGPRRPFGTAGAAAAHSTRLPHPSASRSHRPSFATSAVRPSHSGSRNPPRPSVSGAGALPSLPPFPTSEGGEDMESLIQQWIDQVLGWMNKGGD